METTTASQATSQCPLVNHKYPNPEDADIECSCDEADQSLGPDALTGTVVLARKTETFTAMVIPVRLDEVITQTLDLGPQALKNIEAIATYFEVLKSRAKAISVPIEVQTRIRQVTLPLSVSYINDWENNDFCKLHHAYHCLLGTCSDQWHTLSDELLHEYIDDFHRKECISESQYENGPPRCEDCHSENEHDDDCQINECANSIQMSRKYLCCEDHCADDECDIAEEDSDHECEQCGDDCCCECNCDCYGYCEHEQVHCRSQLPGYKEDLLSYLANQEENSYTTGNAEHTALAMEISRQLLMADYEKVSQILKESFNVGLHVVMSRHSPSFDEEEERSHHKFMAPMAFLYANSSKTVEGETPEEASCVQEIDAQTGRVINSGNTNYYANAASFIPPESASAKGLADSVENLRRCIETLQLEPFTHPMQIAPPPDNIEGSGVGFAGLFEIEHDQEKLWKRIKQAKDHIKEERAAWRERCMKMSWPRRMVLRNVVYDESR